MAGKRKRSGTGREKAGVLHSINALPNSRVNMCPSTAKCLKLQAGAAPSLRGPATISQLPCQDTSRACARRSCVGHCIAM